MRRKDRQIEDRAEVMKILGKADVVRLAMSDDNVPYIVVMNFGFGKEGSLYFHSAGEGRKINILKKNNLVCFQADVEHELYLHNVSCGCSMRYQSVVGMGRILQPREVSGSGTVMCTSPPSAEYGHSPTQPRAYSADEQVI